MSYRLKFRSFAAKVAKRAGIYHILRDCQRDWDWAQRSSRERTEWILAGRPNPPPSCVKQEAIRDLAKRFSLRTLVETGTFYGDTVFVLRHVFRKIHTIELSPDLYAISREKIGHLPHIRLHHGDSAKVLHSLLSTLYEPAIFWLDGHYSAGPTARSSKDTPIREELEILLARPPGYNVVLIDDARLFIGECDYPTIESVRGMILAGRPAATFEVKDDMIRVFPV